MALLDKFIKSKPGPLPNHPGRFSQYHLSERQRLAWAKAQEYHLSENHILAFEHILRSLLTDGPFKNVDFNYTSEDVIEFTLYQGSSKIKGTYNATLLQAGTRLAHASKPKEDLLHRLLVKNHELEYTKFILTEDNDILLQLIPSLANAQPEIIINSFKELSRMADKQDDLLSLLFDQVELVELGHTDNRSNAEKERQIHFLQSEIKTILENIQEEDSIYQKLEYTQVYRIFNFIYAVDFLLTPQGRLMESLEYMHRELHSNLDKNISAKVKRFSEELEKIADWNNEALNQELYKVFYTFNLTPRLTRSTIREIIDNERQQLDWYIENGYEQLAQHIVGYIFGYCLFNFTLPDPYKFLFRIYFQCIFPSCFETEEEQFVDSKGKLEAKNIQNAIKNVERSELWKAASMKWPNKHKLDFSSMPSFACSMLDNIYEMDFYEYADQ